MYVNARYLKNGEPRGRSYVFRCDDEKVEEGDVMLANGKKVKVVGECDFYEEIVKRYGEENIVKLEKRKEQEIIPVLQERTENAGRRSMWHLMMR